MPDDQRGPNVFTQLGVAEESVVPGARRDEIAVAVAARLALLPERA
jgi:hypothetical protein